ncbi:unnamed protein product [Ectocarpus sp. CCAP 1310/34]|nr:unnamed protein product [Ectocarpus sp. CCAP 1310/34]
MAQQAATPSSSDDEEEEEVACFERDTESFMLRRRRFTFPGLPPVVLNQDFVSVEGTGGAVWRPSIEFSEFVCSEEGRRCLPLAGKSVLEISSGLGLGAIVAWHLGAAPVVATDLGSKDGPMALLARNVSENCGPRAVATPQPSPGRTSRDHSRGGEAGSAPEGGSAEDEGAPPPGRRRPPPPPPPSVQSLRWGDKAQLADALRKFDGFGPDVVLACDVVFDDALLPALLETLAEAACRTTRGGGRPSLCVSHQKRNRRREDSFFAALAKRIGGGGQLRMVHQQNDLSVLMFTYLMVRH